MAKVYVGRRNSRLTGITAYSGKLDCVVSISRIFGVVVAVLTPEGELRHEWDLSRCPTEIDDETEKIEDSARPEDFLLQVVSFSPGFLNTIEVCRLYNGRRDVYDATHKAFKSMPYKEQRRKEQRRMEHTPETPEGWYERRNYWSQTLEPVMTGEQFTIALDAISEWYEHCLRLREKKEEQRRWEKNQVISFCRR